MEYLLNKKYKILTIKDNVDSVLLDKLKEINLNRNTEFIIIDIKKKFFVILVENIEYALSKELINSLNLIIIE
ncbi:hypothetical protein [Spiroplasma endosymbiont of Aspidapion aeneum]|uniref:hypothetical protein n=1 Tax=Spiroplasma endosymbiont of Aspidapion aeneum TaxID=3066276 RepID=UPI00313CFA18